MVRRLLYFAKLFSRLLLFRPRYHFCLLFCHHRKGFYSHCIEYQRTLFLLLSSPLLSAFENLSRRVTLSRFVGASSSLCRSCECSRSLRRRNASTSSFFPIISQVKECNTTTKRETLYLCVLCEYYIIKRKQNKESGRLIKALSRSRSSAFCSFSSRSLNVSSSLLTQKQQCVCRKDTPKEALQKCEKKDRRRVPLSFFFELSLKFRVFMRP